MPLYDYQCDHCGRIQEEITSLSELDSKEVECDWCKQKMRRLFPLQSQRRIFKPFVDHHIADTPIEITSKKQWKAECEKRGCVNHYLENSYNRSF